MMLPFVLSCRVPPPPFLSPPSLNIFSIARIDRHHNHHEPPSITHPPTHPHRRHSLWLGVLSVTLALTLSFSFPFFLSLCVNG